VPEPSPDKKPAEPATRAAEASKAPLPVPTEFTARRLVTIQILRGVAALMVVFHHVQDQSPGFKELWPTEVGQAGVDIFFVISGFVMVYVTRERERSAGQFLSMRAIRIIPIYWFYTLAAASLMLVLPQIFRSNELSARHVLLSLLFVPHYTETTGTSPIVKQGWTLNYEVFFYVIFAIAMAISARRRVQLSACVLVGLAAIGYSTHALHLQLGTVAFYLQSIILEFAIGMIIATLFIRGKLRHLGAKVGIPLALAGFGAMIALDPFYSDSMRVFVYGVPASAIVIGALAIDNHAGSYRLPILQFTGDASYSIYLVHGFPVAALRTIWKHGPLPLSGWFSFVLFFAISVIAAVAMGAASYYTIEKPSLKYLRARVQRFF
jgi:exopolysaccharide production protein ExoZ